MYLIKPPSLLKSIYPDGLVWKKDSVDAVYLTFDDGPHLTATEFVLSELEKYEAKATFFCIGKNVVEHPDIYQKIKTAGHRIGNHTHHHVNGWKTNKANYLMDVKDAEQFIDSSLFRPPYGKIKKSQAKAIQESGYEIIMWDVLSGDFDTKITPEKCWENIALNISPGSIVVFHDSTKAWERMKYALPRTLVFCRERNWKMEIL